MKVSNQRRRRVQKESGRPGKPHTKGTPSPVQPGIVAEIGRQIHDRWPNLGQQVASLIRLSRATLDDIYSSAAQAVTERKEALEDRIAEKKSLARAAAHKTLPEAPARSAKPLS